MLNSKRLEFKDISQEELDNIHSLHSFMEVDEFNTLGIPKDKNETKEFISSLLLDKKEPIRKKYCWTVHLKTPQKFIGLAGINISADRFCIGEIYYKILPTEWNKGFGTEIAQQLIFFGFSHLHLHRIEAGVETNNIRSIKILEKIGMVREGVGRKILPIRGQWRDNFRYSILEDDKREY